MDTPLHSDVAWLLTLRAADRARFLALLAHELTLSGRMIAGPRTSAAELRLRVERLRQLNEIQHRVSSYIGYALGPDEDVAFLPIVARYVLEPRDPVLRRSTTRAWTETRKSFVAVPQTIVGWDREAWSVWRRRSRGMTWSARAIDPSLIDAIRSDDKLLEETLFGEPPKALTERLKKDGYVHLSDKQLRDELTAWAAKRKADVGDTEVDLDYTWHGIHYLLTGSAEPDGTLASKVIVGGEDIGPNRGYGPAQLLKPDEVKATAQLLEETTPDMLRKRFKPEEMTGADVYPSVIWEPDGDDALSHVLDNYKKLAAFYRLAAERGQAVILAIS